MRTPLVLATLLGAGLLLSGCQTGPMNANLLNTGLEMFNAATMTDEQMAQTSLAGIRSMDASNRIAPAQSKYGRRLAKLTKAYDSVNGRPLNFKVYISQDINAFAVPDGSIRIMSALMDHMSDDELLFVIGHEIGHVYHGHARKRFQTAYAMSGLVKVASSAGGLNVNASQAGALVSEVVKAQFSQENEREADDYGYDVAVRAGASKTAPAAALRKLAALSQSHSNVIAQMLATHPDPASRAARMDERALKG